MGNKNGVQWRKMAENEKKLVWWPFGSCKHPKAGQNPQQTFDLFPLCFALREMPFWVSLFENKISYISTSTQNINTNHKMNVPKCLDKVFDYFF